MNARDSRIMELAFADTLPVRRGHTPVWLETPVVGDRFREHILDSLFQESPCCEWGSSIDDEGQEMFVILLNYIGMKQSLAILRLAEELDLDWFISNSGQDDSTNTIRLTFAPRVRP